MMADDPTSFPDVYVRLTDTARWYQLRRSGWIPAQIVTRAYSHAPQPVAIGDYEQFVGAVREMPKSAWVPAPPPPC